MKNYYRLISLGTFGITLYYLILSYVRPKQILSLKLRWAKRILKYIGYTVSMENQYTKQGPVIYVGNHMSYLDILVLMSVNPHIVFLAKKEVRSWPILGASATRVGTLYVDRESKTNREQLRKQIGEQLIEQKAHLVIFPSGTTTLEEEKIWKKGIFEIAQEYNIPVQLFKVNYTPYKESSYIDDDTLIDKMALQFSLKNKSSSVTWLDTYTISHPETDAEKLRQTIRQKLEVQL